MQKYLGREDAPIDVDTWKTLDTIMTEAARSVLAGRRVLHVEGPFGLGLKEVPLRDVEVQPGVHISPSVSLALIHTTFTLGKRDLAALEREGVSVGLGPVAKAAVDLARKEDDIIFNGGPGVPGLLSVDGRCGSFLSDWTEMGTAAADIIKGVTALDECGFHGPYALALAPARFNLLYRRSPEGNFSELEQIQTIATEGVFKAPAIKSGGVLIASGRQFASIVLGQDMTIGFVGPSGEDLEFSISESLALIVKVPATVCVLGGEAAEPSA